jgi:hypothetical protein
MAPYFGAASCSNFVLPSEELRPDLVWDWTVLCPGERASGKPGAPPCGLALAA